VYYRTENGLEKLQNADAKTFEILGYHIAKDKNYVYYWDEKLSKIDPKTFEVVEGYYITKEELIKQFPNTKAYGRPHIGKLLIDGGYAKDINDVFKGILRKDSPCYVPKVKVEVPYIIDIIHKAGGLAVMAHPKLVTSDEYVLEMLNYDFDGMEVYHSKHNDDDVERYKEFAKKHKLFITGGSDYHGIVGKKPDRFGDYLVSGKDVSEFISLL